MKKKSKAEEMVHRYEQAKVQLHELKIGVNLAGSFVINGAGEVVSVHLKGAQFQPVDDPAMPEEVKKEIYENRYQLTVALIWQAIENLATRKIEKHVADELGLSEYARQLLPHPGEAGATVINPPPVIKGK